MNNLFALDGKSRIDQAEQTMEAPWRCNDANIISWECCKLCHHHIKFFTFIFNSTAGIAAQVIKYNKYSPQPSHCIGGF